MDKKRIIIIIVLAVFLLSGTAIAALFFFKSREINGPEVEAVSPKTENTKTTVIIDMDNDGLTDEQEKAYGTNPSEQDTDRDGFKDGEEITNGYDPLKPAPGDKIVK